MSDILNTYIFHWYPAKAIWIGGHTLSWDARCAGIHIGFGTTILFHLIAAKKAKYLPALPLFIFFSLLFLPLFIDVFTIHYGYRSPSNDIRYLTGLLFGLAFGVILYPTFIRLSYPAALPRPAINSPVRFVLLLACICGAFVLKYIDHAGIFFILESLAVWGFFCLAAIILGGTAVVLKNSFFSRTGKNHLPYWGKNKQ